jgi:hypothetical protein
MINFKQEELIDGLLREIREHYPEVELIKVMESAENPSTLWIRVTAPDDEEREIEMREFASDKVADILLDYGYHMLVMPTRRLEEAI